MTRTMSLKNDRLGPYVMAFVAGAVAFSSLTQAQRPTADAKSSDSVTEAGATIAEKLLDRLATLYQERQARLRPLP